MTNWRVFYIDNAGRAQGHATSDGRQLSVSIDGCTFHGSSFDGLQAQSASLPTRFRLHGGDQTLCDCTIEVHIPVPLYTATTEHDGTLVATITLGSPAAHGGIDHVGVQLDLAWADRSVRSEGTSGWFEDELLDIVRRLPAGTRLRMCFTCALSDYSPAGQGMFGDMACFMAQPEAYREVRTKQGLFALWPAQHTVQETHHCASFEARTAGAGYRGWPTLSQEPVPQPPVD